METHYSALSGLFEGLLKTVASEMLSVGLIPHAIEVCVGVEFTSTYT